MGMRGGIVVKLRDEAKPVFGLEGQSESERTGREGYVESPLDGGHYRLSWQHV
jgi:hypothetical protein